MLYMHSALFLYELALCVLLSTTFLSNLWLGSFLPSLRTSETNYLYESFIFYDAIRSRGYFKDVLDAKKYAKAHHYLS
jgi:hypothetical protein